MKNGIALALLATGALAVASQIPGFRASPASSPYERDARMSGNPWQFGQGSRNRDLDARRGASKSASDSAGQASSDLHARVGSHVQEVPALRVGRAPIG